MEEEAEEGRREIEKKNDEKKGNEAVKGLCYYIAAVKTPVRKKKTKPSRVFTSALASLWHAEKRINK